MYLKVYCVKVKNIHKYTINSLKVQNQIINLQVCDVNFGLYLISLK